MNKELEVQKERLKDQVTREIDNYYDEISNGIENRTIQIDRIEQMLVEKKAKVNELIREATGEVLTEIEPVTEKNDVQSAKSLCEGKVEEKE